MFLNLLKLMVERLLTAQLLVQYYKRDAYTVFTLIYLKKRFQDLGEFITLYYCIIRSNFINQFVAQSIPDI